MDYIIHFAKHSLQESNESHPRNQSLEKANLKVLVKSCPDKWRPLTERLGKYGALVIDPRESWGVLKRIFHFYIPVWLPWATHVDADSGFTTNSVTLDEALHSGVRCQEVGQGWQTERRWHGDMIYTEMARMTSATQDVCQSLKKIIS